MIQRYRVTVETIDVSARNSTTRDEPELTVALIQALNDHAGLPLSILRILADAVDYENYCRGSAEDEDVALAAKNFVAAARAFQAATDR
jgi:hypothetical protein